MTLIEKLEKLESILNDFYSIEENAKTCKEINTFINNLGPELQEIYYKRLRDICIDYKNIDGKFHNKAMALNALGFFKGQASELKKLDNL